MRDQRSAGIFSFVGGGIGQSSVASTVGETNLSNKYFTSLNTGGQEGRFSQYFNFAALMYEVRRVDSC
jgi:hypothetical protein